VIVDFLENVWYASIEVETFLKTTSTASGDGERLNLNPISEKGMVFCFVCRKNTAGRGLT
jgi:hypothetical protein